MFLALDLPEEARDRLVEWRDLILDGRRDVRPVRPEALHVTLVFLGWQDEPAADRIADAAAAGASAAPSDNTRRSRCMATVVERSRMSARSPGSRTVRLRPRPSSSCTLQQTVPTGFSSLPPSGPAIPVMATAVSASKRRRAPSAIASATGSDTAPWRSISTGSTPRSSTFASFA